MQIWSHGAKCMDVIGGKACLVCIKAWPDQDQTGLVLQATIQSATMLFFVLSVSSFLLSYSPLEIFKNLQQIGIRFLKGLIEKVD